MPKRKLILTGFAVALVCQATLAQAPEQAEIITSLPRPGDREFIRDLAGMVKPEDQKKIRELCDGLLTAKATPIIVVTIRSMADHGGRGMRIETFARLLFDQWQIGIDKINDRHWNTGILLLVSKGDRKARIELGAGWAHDKDDLCSRIMEDLIVPRFKAGEFSEGVVAGVEALDKMARDLEIPRRPRPWWHYALVVGAIALAIFTIVSLIKRGASGWAWVFWGVVFAMVAGLLYMALRSSGSGDGFGGGAFGGGSSGGGGATGSW